MDRQKIRDIGTAAGVFYAVIYLMIRFSDLNATQSLWIYLLVCAGILHILKFRLNGRDNALIGNRMLHMLSFLLSLTMITGVYFDNDLSFENMTVGIFINYFMCVICFTPLCKCVFAFVFQYMELMAKRERNTDKDKHNKRIIGGGAFVIVLGCWILVWAAYYPGLWNYDPWQVLQFSGNDYNKHHPLIHTVLLGLCYSVGAEGADCNKGVILYDLIQMSVMAGIFAYTYVFICQHIWNKIFRGMVLVFYAVFPVNSILAISTTKDVIFSGLVLLCLVLAIQLPEITSKWKRDCLAVILLIVCTMMLLFRNNAIYAFYLFTACTCLLGIRGIMKKSVFAVKTMLFSFCCILLFQASDSVMTQALDAEAGSVREMFSVPSQQLGRIYNVIQESGTDPSAVAIIESYYDMEKAHYNPHLADPMKGVLDLKTSTEIKNYIGDSLELFRRYPVESLDAFLYLNEGGWYIQDISNADIYGHGLERRAGVLLTDVKEGYHIAHESKLPKLELFMEKAFSDNQYQNWLVLSLLFCPALYVWILLICTLIYVRQKNWKVLLPTGFLWVLYLTNLLGPCVIIRYYYPLFVCSPLLLCMAVVSIRGSVGGKE